MKPIFVSVWDAVTNRSMLIRVDLVKTIAETTLDGKECRIITFLDGSHEYVNNSMEVLAHELNDL